MRVPVKVNVERYSSIVSSTKTNDPKSLNQFETIIVELQGTLESSAPDQALDDLQSSLEGAEIGDLDIANPDKPILRIGNHELDGKCIKLGKPLVVLRRRERSSNPEPSLRDVGSENRAFTQPPTAHEFDIVDLIHRKFIFSRRPQPIVSNQT